MWDLVQQCAQEYSMASLERCIQLRDTVSQAWNDFESWVHSQAWSDGRAARQALDRSKDPYQSVQRVLGWINARIDSLSGGGGSSDTSGAAPKTNTMLYVGGGLLAAKLLGFL